MSLFRRFDCARLSLRWRPSFSVLGADKGKVVIADDFDAPLPAELLAAFEK